MKQMILKIDESAVFSELSEDLQAAIKEANIQWPEGQLIGTHLYYSKQLILILTPLSKSEIESIINDFELPWKVLAVEGVKINQSPILKFINAIDLFDEEGEPAGTETVKKLNGILQTFAGHKWIY